MAKDLKSVIAFAGQRSGAASARSFGSATAAREGAAAMQRSAAIRLYALTERHAGHDDCRSALRLLVDAARAHGAYIASEHAPYTMDFERDRAVDTVLGCFISGGYKEP